MPLTVLTGTLSLADTVGRAAPKTLVVAGGGRSNGRSAPEQHLAAWLREHHRGVQRIVSVCAGAFVLGEAGLLDGRRATTHWRFREELRERFPTSVVTLDDIFLRDGRIWTSAGITAGIDMMLAIVEEITDKLWP